ncbi:MAG TPA: hypothetical protein VIV11_24525 [Kofleriaceae bacterium]
MSEQSRGVRTLPPALVIAFAVWFVMTVVRLIFLLSAKEPWAAVRFNLVSEGTGFATEALAVAGAYELLRRVSGLEALGVRLALVGLIGALSVNVTWGFVQFMEKAWEHEWIYQSYNYAYFGVWLLVPIGIATALWREKRELGIFIVLVMLLTWPPPFLATHMYSWLPSGKSGFVIETSLRALRYVMLFAGFAMIARGAAISDQVRAAAGLRTAAKALWLRIIAAVGLVLFTLLLIGSKAGQGAVSTFKLVTLAAFIINIIALVQFGLGALRSARGNVADLGRWPFVIGGGASLWGAGVMLGQLPWLYKMLYKSDSGMFSRSETTDWAQALSLAMPLVITAGVAAIAVAISGFAARRAREDLRASAQAKGAGYVALSLVALAIMQWMIPEAMKGASMGTYAMLSLLAAGASLVAIVMMARLLNEAAAALESEPGLPPAQVVTDGT